MKKNDTIELTLSSPPPSLNNSTLVSNGRKVKSSAYRKWLKDAVIELQSQRKTIFRDAAYWRSEILIPWSLTGADVDNLPKGCHDALVKAGKTPDDRYLMDTRIRFYGGRKVRLYLTIEELTKWIPITKPGRELKRKLEKSQNLSLRL